MINTTPNPIYTNEDHAFDKLESKLPKDAIINPFETEDLITFRKKIQISYFFSSTLDKIANAPSKIK